MQRITPFLWYDKEAEEAAKFYCSVFNNSKVLKTARYGDAGPGPKGSVMTVQFQLDGQQFIALNGGPQFPFTEAISLSVACKDQKEVDHFWEKLSAGGDAERQGSEEGQARHGSDAADEEDRPQEIAGGL